MKVSIIVPAYNSESVIVETIDSIKKIQPADSEIIIVDNNSKDRTREIVEKIPDVKYLFEGAQGTAYARNKGISNSAGDIIIFVDQGISIDKNCFDELIKVIRNEKVGVVAGISYSIKPKNIISRSQEVRLMGYSTMEKEVRDINIAPTMVAAFSKKALLEIGMFDTTKFPVWGEDADVSLRLRKAGYKVLLNPKAFVLHDHPETFKDAYQKWFNYGRGWLLICRKHNNMRDVILNLTWLGSLALTLSASLFYPTMLFLFALIFAAPWTVFYGRLTLVYMVSKKSPEAILFPLIHQINIFARSLGIVYQALKR